MSSTRTRRWMRLAGWGVYWIACGLEVLAMGLAGLAKFRSMDGWFYWFARFGYPPRFALVVGAVEFVLAGLLLLPRFASWAAIGLAVVMFGALEAVLTTETDLGWFAPTLHLAFLALIGTVQWSRRWRPWQPR